MRSRSDISGLEDWHPRSHIFTDPTISEVMASRAIREGDRLRRILLGRRILPDLRSIEGVPIIR